MDQLTGKHQHPVIRFGIEWMLGSSDTPLTGSIRRIELVGMKGPNKFFTLFSSPRKLCRNHRGTGKVCIYSCLCVHVALFVRSNTFNCVGVCARANHCQMCRSKLSIYVTIKHTSSDIEGAAVFKEM